MNTLNAVISLAQSLSSAYTAIGAPKSQNVRNLLSMHQLILAALPTLPHPDKKLRVTTPVNARAYGVVKAVELTTEFAPASFLGADYMKAALTVDEVMTSLKDAGFIANHQSVRRTLCDLKRDGKITSVPVPRPAGVSGRRQHRYFVSQ